MLNQTTITIKGITPLIMHNGRLADPLDEATQALAKITGKRKKTHDDHLAMAKCEWYGGLYTDEDGAPCLPGEVIESCLVEGAKKYKLGKVAKGAVVVDGNFALEYDGPKDIDKLWERGGFVKRAGVRVAQARVIRRRPIFPAWSCAFVVSWDASMIRDLSQLMEIVESAGSSGIGDWRPKFGRFEIV